MLICSVREKWGVVWLLVIGACSSTAALSCHQCNEVTTKALSKDDRKIVNQKENCSDTATLSECSKNFNLGYCVTREKTMRKMCRKSCDMCTYTQKGGMQVQDEKYWSQSSANRTYLEAFFWQPIPYVQIAQSSTFEKMDHTLNTANLSQDGDVNTYSQTLWEYDPWLMVQIESVYVYQVVIINRWNRSTTHREDIRRLDGVTVSLIDDDVGNTSVCGSVVVREGYAMKDQIYKINCTGERATRVKLQGPPGVATFLHIAELQILAYDGGMCGSTLVKKCISNYSAADTCSKLVYSGWWRGKEMTLTKRGCSTMFTKEECLMKSDNGRLKALGVNFQYDGCSSYYCDEVECNKGGEHVLNISLLFAVLYLAIQGHSH